MSDVEEDFYFDLDEVTFEKADAESTEGYFCDAGELKKGGYVTVSGHPCQIVATHVSKTGKHGHAKITFVAIDLFTDRKYQQLLPSDHQVEVPTVEKHDYQVNYIDDEGYLHVIDEHNKTREDLKVPEDELGDALMEAFEEDGVVDISVLEAAGKEKIFATRRRK